MDWHFATSEGPLGEQVSAGCVGGTVVVVVGIAEVVIVSVVVWSSPVGVVTRVEGRDVTVTGEQPDSGDCWLTQLRVLSTNTWLPIQT